MTKKINIPYSPRAIWKTDIHPALDVHRFAVIVAHRRFGKTVGSVNQIVKRAVQCELPAPQYAYVAPYRTQAKKISWSYLKYYVSVIPDVRVNESELYIELPSKHPNRAGARIYIIGADNPDSLRGIYLDGVVIDEYAQIKQELWNEIIRPALSDRLGWAVFIGTPKGQNQFYEIYQRALISDGWYTCLKTVDETGIIPIEELASMKEEMTEDAIRQELYCDFTASASNVLIPIDLVNKGINKRIITEDIQLSPVVFGVDVARFGDDVSVIQRRKGLCAYEPIVIRKMDNMMLADRIATEINQYNPDAVFIDAGRGEGVIDRLRQLGYGNIIEVPFGSKAIKDDKYVNKRAEMWDNIRLWLEQGGGLPQNTRLRAELSIPEYFYDNAGRIQLEPKEKIKERVGYSPDVADALALTFARPVASKNNRVRRNTVAKTSYNPF